MFYWLCVGFLLLPEPKQMSRLRWGQRGYEEVIMQKGGGRNYWWDVINSFNEKLYFFHCLSVTIDTSRDIFGMCKLKFMVIKSNMLGHQLLLLKQPLYIHSFWCFCCLFTSKTWYLVYHRVSKSQWGWKLSLGSWSSCLLLNYQGNGQEPSVVWVFGEHSSFEPYFLFCFQQSCICTGVPTSHFSASILSF